MIYLTYGEPPSGVYSSQVCDVVNFLKSKHQANIRLLAFISIHDFKKSKKQIISQCPDAIVIPALPKVVFWRFNSWILWFILLWLRAEAVIARNVIAANMALASRRFTGIQKICFDGRGAIAAEWHEYDVDVDQKWKSEIAVLEQKAVLQSDFRIAVSQRLVDYWKNKYGYVQKNHVVIPCTLGSEFIISQPDKRLISKRRNELGYQDDDVLFAYSGSTAGWQSFELLYTFLQPVLKKNKNHKVLFLAKDDENIEQLKKEFPNQVTQKWLSHAAVKEHLNACDYGILTRENTVTNQVASPTKFAEYLSAGLPVIISENLGDYSKFTIDHKCGITLPEAVKLSLFNKPDDNEKKNMTGLAMQYFTKEACSGRYAELLEQLYHGKNENNNLTT